MQANPSFISHQIANISHRSLFAVASSSVGLDPSCGTLTDMAEFVRDKELNESLKSKYDRIEVLIAEIQLLVDVLFGDPAAIAPGDAA